MGYIETPSLARVPVVLKLPSTKLITYHCGAPRAHGERARWPDVRARHSGTRRAATLAHATPPTIRGTSKHLPLHVLLLFSNYQVPHPSHTAVARPQDAVNAHPTIGPTRTETKETNNHTSSKSIWKQGNSRQKNTNKRTELHGNSMGNRKASAQGVPKPVEPVLTPRLPGGCHAACGRT